MDLYEYLASKETGGPAEITVRSAANRRHIWIEQEHDAVELNPLQAANLIETLKKFLESV
jgi:hypothetical protein